MGKLKVKLYARKDGGSTLINITNNRNILRMYLSSLDQMLAYHKEGKLPYEIYVEAGDLKKVKESVYGYQANMIDVVEVFTDTYRAASQPIFVVRDIADAPITAESAVAKAVSDHAMVVCDSVGSCGDLCTGCGGAVPHMHSSCEPCPRNKTAQCKEI